MKLFKLLFALGFGLAVACYSMLSSSVENGERALNESYALSVRVEYLAMAQRGESRAHGLGACALLAMSAGALGLLIGREREKAKTDGQSS